MDIEELRLNVIHCGLPLALEIVGDRWTFLILRAATVGLCHFEQFQSQLGIARNILANRLAKMVQRGLLERQECDGDRRRVRYTLTDKGEALFPALVALRQWGERWESDTPSDPVLVDRRDRKPIREMSIIAADGREVKLRELTLVTRAEFDQS